LAPKSNSPVSKPAPASPKPIGLDGIVSDKLWVE
jgi:hypothetical protein